MSVIILLILAGTFTSLTIFIYSKSMENSKYWVTPFASSLVFSFLIVVGAMNSEVATSIINERSNVYLLSASIDKTTLNHKILILEKILKHNKELANMLELNKMWIWDSFIDDNITNTKPIIIKNITIKVGIL